MTPPLTIRLAWSAVLLALAAAPAATQLPAADSAAEFKLAATWTPARISNVAPLRRAIALNLDGASVKQALREIGRLSGIHIAYGDDVLHSDARVSVHADGVTVQEALGAVLEGTGLDAFVSLSGKAVLVRAIALGDSTQTGTVSGRVTDAKTGQAITGATVVLIGTRWHATTDEKGVYNLAEVTPGSYTLTASRIGYTRQSQSVTVATGQEATVDVRLEVSASPLDAVVVTGTIVPTERKELSNPITVITGEDIQRRGITQINELFRGESPGVFAGEKGTAARTGGGASVQVRGVSSIQTGNILKTYVDGVELSNSEYLDEVDPRMIERIEIIRGPEASTSYGAQATNGVMQVFTKRGQLGAPPHWTASLGAGAIESPYGTGVRHDDNVSVTGGTADLSYNVGATYQHEGAWTPGYRFDNYSAYGGLSAQLSGKLRVDASARVGRQVSHGGNDVNVLAKATMDGTISFSAGNVVPNSFSNSLPQQTVGLTVHYAPLPQWQHTLTVGFDRAAGDPWLGYGYVLTARFRKPSDSLATVETEEATRTTAAYNSAVDLHLTDALTANVVVGADRWDYDINLFNTRTATSVGTLGTGSALLYRQPDHNTGVFSQVRFGVRDALFLTAGVRVDEGPDLPADRHHRYAAPRVGASYSVALGPVSAKVRAEYGRALKPANPNMKEYVPQPQYNFAQLAAPNLLPEQQTGWDAGVEIYAGDRASVSVTHYDQLARDLIYYATVAVSPIYEVQLQNLARVHNTGWELEGMWRLLTGLSVKATYSTVNSVIDETGPNFQGDYQVGDALLGVPHHTGALTLTKTTPQLSVEAALSYVSAIRDYDNLTYILQSSARLGTQSFTFPKTTFPSTTRLGLRLSYRVTAHLALFGRGENLANSPVVNGLSYFSRSGRTTLFGVRIQ